MTTLTATPEPGHIPPRVRIDVAADTDQTISDVTLTRDGVAVREQPYPGGPAAVTFDYEAPFGTPATYTAEGSSLPAVAPDWAEEWVSLDQWAGDTGSFTVGGGKAHSAVGAARIVRSASGTIQRLDVTDPSSVRVELLDGADVLVGSVQVDVSVTVVGTKTTTVAGTGSFTVALMNGQLVATAADGSWTAVAPYTGTPVKVRVVSLGQGYQQGFALTNPGEPRGAAIDTAGNLYVPDKTNSRVRKYSPTGTLLLNIPVGSSVFGVALDSAGNIYVVTGSGVKKYNPTGGQVATFPVPYGLQIAVDASGDIYVTDPVSSKAYRYSSAGTLELTITLPAAPQGVVADSSGNIYVTTAANTIRKYDSAGTFLVAFGVGNLGIAIDSSDNLYVADGSAGVFRKYASDGALLGVFPAPGAPRYIGVNPAGSVVAASSTSTSVVRQFVSFTSSVGEIVVTPVVTPIGFVVNDSTILDVTEAWLIHPTFSSLSKSIDPGQHKFRDDGINVDVATKTSATRAARATRHDPSGRKQSVIFTSGPRAAGEWDLKLYARRLQDRDSINDLCDDQSPLLLRSPAGWVWDLPDGWYSVGDLTEDRPKPRLDQSDRIVTLPLTPVPEPLVRLAPVWTYAADFLRNPTYQDSRDEFPTYFDRLVGP